MKFTTTTKEKVALNNNKRQERKRFTGASVTQSIIYLEAYLTPVHLVPLLDSSAEKLAATEDGIN